jgi:hypothetical protein
MASVLRENDGSEDLKAIAANNRMRACRAKPIKGDVRPGNACFSAAGLGIGTQHRDL